jgi:hypothetical protein
MQKDHQLNFERELGMGSAESLAEGDPQEGVEEETGDGMQCQSGALGLSGAGAPVQRLEPFPKHEVLLKPTYLVVAVDTVVAAPSLQTGLRGEIHGGVPLLHERLGGEARVSLGVAVGPVVETLAGEMQEDREEQQSRYFSLTLEEPIPAMTVLAHTVAEGVLDPGENANGSKRRIQGLFEGPLDPPYSSLVAVDRPPFFSLSNVRFKIYK